MGTLCSTVVGEELKEFVHISALAGGVELEDTYMHSYFGLAVGLRMLWRWDRH